MCMCFCSVAAMKRRLPLSRAQAKLSMRAQFFNSLLVTLAVVRCVVGSVCKNVAMSRYTERARSIDRSASSLVDAARLLSNVGGAQSGSEQGGRTLSETPALRRQ